MVSSQASSAATLDKEPIASPKSGLRLDALPPIFVSETHLETGELHELEDNIIETGATLSYDLNEARIVLTKAERKRRIQMDLRTKGCYTEEILPLQETTPLEARSDPASEPVTKRQKLSDTEELGKNESEALVIDDMVTDSETEDESRAKPEPVKRKRKSSSVEHDGNEGYFSNENVKVIKLQWFEDCKKQNSILPIEPYLLYHGRQIEKPEYLTTPIKGPNASIKDLKTPQSILERARADATADSSSPITPHGPRRLGQIGGGRTRTSGHTSHIHLLQQTTSEHDLGASSDMPEMPDWVKDDIKYACQRSTPADPPNEAFIAELKKIKLARLLTGDEIGVRAYSTSIASLAAYPHKLSNPREILLLPGCDAKIANLYIEYANHGIVQEAQDAEENEELKVLRVFYDIWGVGATTAREFYHDRGWRDLDDVIEHGWSTLSRVQQIGVKYYNEFLSPIPRSEAEDIASIIHRHAVKVRNDGIQSTIVGGYRRNNPTCGDVDILISHPDESKTLHIISDIVASLEEENQITHTLLISHANSSRHQQTLPLKSTQDSHSGFDTLDKALLVWQDPHFPPDPADPKAKNPNLHRRVDIIISPWKTVGCAVMGWSGGTTFQRDLRRYVRAEKGWKFDSSGIRDRETGVVVDVDGFGVGGKDTIAKSMEEAERRVFENMGLVWREPWERCTG